MQDPVTDIATRLVHDGYMPPSGFMAPQPAVHKASTVIFPDVASMRSRDWKDKSGYTYGLHGTPTTFILEERLCTLEGGLQCVLVPSGLAAIALTALSLLQPGDEVLLPDNVYGPSKELADGELARFGIKQRLYDPLDCEDLARCITPATRLVWLETPGSVTLEFPNLCEQVRICRARGVTSALDNTWGAGLAFNAFDLLGDGTLGADISVHALTKYPSGGGDVLMGSVITRDEALHMKIKLAHMRLGLGVGANDAEAILRALPSIGLRYRAHSEAAVCLARWMQEQPSVAQVLHPALPESPGHAHWLALCAQREGQPALSAGLFSVVFDARYTQAQVDAFCDSLSLFKLGYSWGGPMSLVVPYQLSRMRSRPVPHLQPGHLVRFSVGLEAVQDLQNDLQQSLQKAFGTQ